MSQNQSAGLRQTRAADADKLRGIDVLLAVLLHALVIALIAALGFWQQQHRPQQPRRIQVSMISAEDLARMQHREQRKAKAKPESVVRPKASPKPAVKPSSTRKANARPSIKPNTPRPKKTPEAFDPFAPLISSSNRSATPRTSSSPAVTEMIAKQLSQQEIDHYIALMREAVQRRWKVPARIGNVRDPLVEVRLHPDGSIAGISILESSGNQALDDSLIRAIKAAAPFTVPREQFEFFRINRIRFHPLK